jgi:hypothetical protein
VQARAFRLHLPPGDERAELPRRLAELTERSWPQAHGADSVVAAAEPKYDAAGMELGERRDRRGRHRHVPRNRIRDRDPDGHALGGCERVRHVDVDILPENLPFDEPQPPVTLGLGPAHTLEEERHPLGEEVGSDPHGRHPLFTASTQ